MKDLLMSIGIVLCVGLIVYLAYVFDIVFDVLRMLAGG